MKATAMQKTSREESRRVPGRNFAIFSSKTGTSWSKIALTNIYCCVSELPAVDRRLVMNPQNATSPLPPLELPPSLLPVVPVAEVSANSTAADCLYQIAALAAGAIFLATLL
jgi:hypothetical protein